ncbi:metallophosphoesterase [Aquabacterium sp.]|uniref:metallophosphoesterase family protein n=1 Tax=Aquabacterium sp. TaxID=1872578 RepID=UPI0024870730|nr:metallophosphoesterase [Aquabacterium sp.]MDI1257754.1 metallophosphoesterase [Aquabacterium sp.]
MSVLLQISDPHFGTEQSPVMAALLRLAQAQKPDIVVWSGDITQRARRSQFSAARRFADEITTPHRLVIPGNHDIPLFNVAARLLAPYANFQHAFGPELAPCISTPQWLVIGVNTTRPWRHKNGEVSAAQIGHVADRLKAAQPGQVKVVVVHQPVCVTLDSDRENLLKGHEAALLNWGAAGVDLILGGHIHLPYVVPQHSCGGATERAFWVVQAGTALSSRVRGGQANSVNLIRRARMPGQATSIERWDYDQQHAAFALVSRLDVNVPTAR